MTITCNRNDYLELAAPQQHQGLIVLIRRHSARTECINILRLIERADATASEDVRSDEVGRGRLIGGAVEHPVILSAV